MPILRKYLPPSLVKKALSLAVPVAGAYFVLVLGLLVEFIIVGNALGGEGLAALGLAATLSLVLVLSFHAIELGAQAIIARRFGEGNRAATGAVLDNALVMSFGLGVPLALSLYALGPAVFGAKSKVIEELAHSYFQWRLPSVPFVIAALAMIGFFNGIGRPKIPMYVYAVILSMNGVLGYVFVNGFLFIPAMGIKGAGLAQTVAAAVGLFVFLWVLKKREYRRDFNALNFRKNFSPKIIKGITKVAWPVLLQQFFGNFGVYLFMIINGKVPDGGVSLAAATIARQIGYLTYLPSIGFGIAAATIVGQSLGSKRPRRAEYGGLICWGLGAVFMVTLGLGFILFRGTLIDIFLASSNGSPNGGLEGAENMAAVKKLAETLLIIVGCYQIFESMNTILSKALQGAGDTYFVMKWAVIFQWVFFLPLAWLMALPLGMGALGALIAFFLQLVGVGSLFMYRFRRGHWKKKKV